jgi:hypothetical protein
VGAELAAPSDITPPTVTQYLKVLRRAGVIACERSPSKPSRPAGPGVSQHVIQRATVAADCATCTGASRQPWAGRPRGPRCRARSSSTRRARACQPHLPQHAAQEIELPVHDVSRGGLAILAHPDEAPLAPGMQVRDAEVELESGDVVVADFKVQNMVLHDAAEATFRFGCAWTQMSAQAKQLVQDWTQRARRRKQVMSLDL